MNKRYARYLSDSAEAIAEVYADGGMSLCIGNSEGGHEAIYLDDAQSVDKLLEFIADVRKELEE